MKTLRIVLNNKNGDIIYQNTYYGYCFADIRKDFIVVLNDNSVIEKIWFSDYDDFDSCSVYNYE